jgi:hypothetical protein
MTTERIVDEANVLVSTYYGYEGDDKEQQVSRCLANLRRAVTGDRRAHFILDEALKDAKPFPVEGWAPLEGAEELTAALSACPPCGMEEQLKRVTAEATRLRHACEAIRDLWRKPAPAQRQDVAFQQAVGIACIALDPQGLGDV